MKVYVVTDDCQEFVGLAKDRWGITELIARKLRCGPGRVTLGQNKAQVRIRYPVDGWMCYEYNFREEKVVEARAVVVEL